MYRYQSPRDTANNRLKKEYKTLTFSYPFKLQHDGKLVLPQLDMLSWCSTYRPWTHETPNRSWSGLYPLIVSYEIVMLALKIS